MKQLSCLCAFLLVLGFSLPALADTAPYRLQYGDALSVTVVAHPELSLERQPIRPDGRIALPLIKDVFVQGKTVPEATEDLSRAFLAFLNKPQVVISVMKFRPCQVTVFGQVGQSGTFDFEEEPTLINAIARAGGLTKRAVRGNIKVVDPSGSRTYDLDRLLTEKTFPRLHEGSIVEVGEMWGPDLDQSIVIFTSLVGSALLLLRPW